jgi:hypothetical protein
MPAHKFNAVSGVGRRVLALKLYAVPGDLPAIAKDLPAIAMCAAFQLLDQRGAGRRVLACGLDAVPGAGRRVAGGFVMVLFHYLGQLTTLLTSKVGFEKFSNRPTLRPVALRYDRSWAK